MNIFLQSMTPAKFIVDGNKIKAIFKDIDGNTVEMVLELPNHYVNETVRSVEIGSIIEIQTDA